MNLDDMPPRMRKAAVAALARDLDKRARPKVIRPGRSADRSLPAPSTRAGSRYRCETCGATFDPWAAAQRHADTHGGARISLQRL